VRKHQIQGLRQPVKWLLHFHFGINGLWRLKKRGCIWKIGSTPSASSGAK
jgi:hypothetical protein